MSSVVTEWVKKASWSTMSDMDLDPSHFVPDFERDRELWEERAEARQQFEDFRDEMIAKYPDTKLMVSVSQPNAQNHYYGPFSNGADLCAWIGIQPMNVRFSVIPLRNPLKRRTTQDFFDPFVGDKKDDRGIDEFRVNYSVTPNA